MYFLVRKLVSSRSHIQFRLRWASARSVKFNLGLMQSVRDEAYTHELSRRAQRRRFVLTASRGHSRPVGADKKRSLLSFVVSQPRKRVFFVGLY